MHLPGKAVDIPRKLTGFRHVKEQAACSLPKTIKVYYSLYKLQAEIIWRAPQRK
jgi:hypothetical protein